MTLLYCCTQRHKPITNPHYFWLCQGKWQYYNSNHGRFDFHRGHEGKHWYAERERGHVAADDLAKEHAIEFLKVRPKEKPFAMTVAL
jgi:hypothetical protein